MQKGINDQARLVMVTHPVLESQFFAATAEISKLDVMRTAAALIRVIEEEF